MLAARHGHSTVVDTLLEAGADVAVQDEDQNSVFHLAFAGNVRNRYPFKSRV